MNSLWWPDWAAKVIKVQRCPWHPGDGELHPDPWQASRVRVKPLTVRKPGGSQPVPAQGCPA
jgi:hypothetical protein